MPNLMIATPAYGEIFYAPYVQSLIKLVRSMQTNGWGFSHRSISYAEISESRNYLLTYWFDRTEASHILFIDADMGFEPQLIMDMVKFDKPVVGVIAPKRTIDLRRLAKLASEGGTIDQAVSKAHEHVFRPLPGGGDFQIEEGFMSVEACGAGILLIERSCIEVMLQRHPGISDERAKKTSPLAKDLDRLIRAFDILRVDDLRLSEDYSFCHRWKHGCNGEIWACVAHEIVHIGLHQFRSRYADNMPVRPGQSMTGRLRASIDSRGKEREKKR